MAGNSKNNDLVQEHQPEYILSSLCAKAPDIEIRDCLRQYNSKFPLKQLKTAFASTLKQVLVRTATYLNINSENMLKPALIHNIICRIQNLLPDQCQVCNEIYLTKLDDEPFLACDICGQEVHKTCFMKLLGMVDNNASPQINPCKLPGIHYLCKECEEGTIPPNDSPVLGHHDEKEEQPDELSQAQLSIHVEATTSLQDTQATFDELNVTQLSNQLNVADLQSPVASLDDKSVDKGSPDVDPNNTDTTTSNETNSDKVTPEPGKKNKICIHYKKNQCKYGLKGVDCPFYHPERCKKLMHFGTKQPDGCNLGRKCHLFHPKMCPLSISKRECFDDKCNFLHVKGTKRKKIENAANQKTPIKKHQTSTKSSKLDQYQTLNKHQTSNKSSELSDQPFKPGSASSKTVKDILADANEVDSNEVPSKLSFLEMIRLLKVELSEAMDTKIATAISQLPHYYPRIPLQPQSQLHQPQFHHPQMQFPQLQMPQYQMMMPPMFPPPMFPPPTAPKAQTTVSQN